MMSLTKGDYVTNNGFVQGDNRSVDALLVNNGKE